MNTPAFSRRTVLPPPGTPLTEEQKEAIRAVAGRRRNDPSTELWMEEVEKFRERLNQEEIARQDELERK